MYSNNIPHGQHPSNTMSSSGPPRQAAQSPLRPRPIPVSATTTVSISASAAAAMSTSHSSPVSNLNRNLNLNLEPNNKSPLGPLDPLDPLGPPLSSRPPSHTPPSSSSTPTPDIRPDPQSRRHTLPFSFPPLFHQNTTTTSSTSASLVPSTALGKPIPLDHETTSHRTLALRELNSTYPSRHRPVKSTGAQSTTYSQPVVVRTYSGPPSRPAGTSRSGRQAYSTTSRLRYPFSSTSTTQSTPVVRDVGRGLLGSSMVRAKNLARGKKHLGRNDQQPARLPPVEAFSFKSFMADASLQQDISTDLDRIAEICARSRYSLSNQYEVHVAPHGNGSAFVAGSAPSGGGLRAVGPSLQPVSSDDERGHRKRRSAGRRKSVAYGTLETIMSSSRSSEEDKTHKKKSAAEIADQVGGRAARNQTAPAQPSSPKTGSPKKTEEIHTRPADTHDGSGDVGRLARKKSASFATAIIDSSRHHVPLVPQVPGEYTQEMASPRNSTAALHSEPALPQTSSSHLEIRTTPDQVNGGATHVHESQSQSPAGRDATFNPLSFINSKQSSSYPVGILSSLGSWTPWGGVDRSGNNGRRNGAEGSLRQLLMSTDDKPGKGKFVDRTCDY